MRRVSCSSIYTKQGRACKTPGLAYLPNASYSIYIERFYKGADGNSGLGLAISKDVIEKLGGCIKEENISDGTGARFIITVPVA